MLKFADNKKIKMKLRNVKVSVIELIDFCQMEVNKLKPVMIYLFSWIMNHINQFYQIAIFNVLKILNQLPCKINITMKITSSNILKTVMSNFDYLFI